MIQSLTRNDEIEAITKDILVEAYGIQYTTDIPIPIDLKKVLLTRGITFTVGSPSNLEVASILDATSRTIYASVTVPVPMMTFAAAHQFGHLLLHSTINREAFLKSDGTDLNKTGLTTEEQEANWFAVCLLIPQESLRKFADVRSDIEFLASSFGVTTSAMLYRIKNLSTPLRTYSVSV